MPINQKLCECGCGRPTDIAQQTKACYGHVKGEPLRFLQGHKVRHPLSARFAAKTTPATDLSPNGMSGCIVWTGALTPKGYGSISRDGTAATVAAAHRVAYELAGHEVPRGMQLDHLCRRRHCVNVEHLQPVTNAENVRRGRSAKLTAEQVRAMRARRASGTLLRELSVEYRVSIACAHHAVTCVTWGDI